MQATPAPITKLIDEFSRLPGIGPKTASRLTFYLLRSSPEQAQSLAEALQELHEKVVFCSRCFHIDERDPCAFCTNENRDRSIICVVEEPLDVLAIERELPAPIDRHRFRQLCAPGERFDNCESPRLGAMR